MISVIARHHFLDSTEKVAIMTMKNIEHLSYQVCTYQLSYDFFSQVFDSGTGYITVLPLIWPEGRSVDELREVNRKFKTDIWQLICTAPCSGDQKLDD